MKRFYLKPIGTLRSMNHKEAVVQLEKEYLPGMKYLEKFSHLILFYEAKSSLRYVIAAHEAGESGMIRLLWVSKQEEMNAGEIYDVYDIKPYFPCEDRVLTTTQLSNGSKIPVITELQKTDINTEELIQLFPNVHAEGIRELKECGRIKQEAGKTYVQFDHVLPECKGYVRIFWWFHRFDQKRFRMHYTCQPPYENAPVTGVFATRSPVRPNPIAMTTARVVCLEEENRRIQITPIDAYDGTSVIAMLAYQPELEAVDGAVVPEWLKHWPDHYQETDRGLDGDVTLQESGLSSLVKEDGVIPEPNYVSVVKDKAEVAVREPGIHVIGARQNNLKNISVTIPENQITAVTGVSGSGKSSLVFDTIYAESQRRFFTHMNIAGMDELEKPVVEEIYGLPPAIAIAQMEAANQPRSTVGTYTELYDSLCRLYAVIGIRHCPICGMELNIMSEDEIYQLIHQMAEREPIAIAAYGTNDWITYQEQGKELIHFLLSEGNGAIQLNVRNQKILLQTKQICYPCGHLMFELTPSTFKFNQPESMCPDCKGLGYTAQVDEEKIVKDGTQSLLDHASDWWKDLRKFMKEPTGNWMKGEIIALAQNMHVDLEQPWNELNPEFKKKALYGTEEEIRWEVHSKSRGDGVFVRRVYGAVNHIKRLYYDHGSQKSIANDFMKCCTCQTCNGERLAREGRMVTVAKKRIPQLTAMPMTELLIWMESLEGSGPTRKYDAVRELVQEMEGKLKQYVDAGLGYLTLNRSLPSLSGGEFGRLRLIGQLRNGLSHILYIFDEPSRGLHPKDYDQILNTFRRLRDDGNTVLMVEHAGKMILESDYLIDIGPKANEKGGTVVAQGVTRELLSGERAVERSSTLACLTGKRSLHRRISEYDLADAIALNHLTNHNLHDLNVTIPKKALVCVTGVSGSGKSSLMQMILDKTDQPVEYMNQKPIGKTVRSTPATYSGILDCLRILFARTKEAKEMHLTPQYFSYNTVSGQCDSCKGAGEVKFLNQLSSSLKMTCPVCKGKRYKQDVLRVQYHGKTIADILSMSADELNAWAEECRQRETDTQCLAQIKNIIRLTALFQKVGIGYLKMGQSSTTISGGEAQWLKLMNHLSKNTKETLFLLDEPTAGLHESDIQNLLDLFDELIQGGNSSVMIEHNVQVIRLADYIIDMGPGAGADGGRIVAAGSVEEIRKNKESVTARYLA